MNNTFALPIDGGLADLSESLAFLAFPTKKSSRRLTGSMDEVVRNIALILDQILMSVIEKRTAPDFKALVEKVFPKYLLVTSALSRLASAVIPPPTLERLTFESLSEMEAEFRDRALAAFGADMQRQALFTVWTFRKINDLAQKIVSAGDPQDGVREKDQACVRQFAYHAMTTRFFLDCLLISLRTEHPIYPEVLEEVSHGLRSAVDAYAWIRQGVELRIPGSEPLLEALKWDEEDQELLDLSMSGIENEQY